MHKTTIRQRTIAKTAGIPESLLSLILNGKRRATPNVAAKLEMATGIRRLCWLYPDEYPNPLIRISDNPTAAQADS